MPAVTTNTLKVPGSKLYYEVRGSGPVLLCIPGGPTDAGVFSPSRLDPGTRLLLEEAPAPPARGDVLDLGCGYGPVACVLAARSPGAAVWAVDVNERALELCARNARTVGLANVRCLPPGDSSLPDRFAAIWSNPPVRIGKEALHALLSGWLGRLEPAGHAYLVVGRNLGADSLHRWLAGQGWPVTRLAARSGYRLLQVAGHPAVANDVGVVHGILYIIYLVFAWLLARRLRLTAKPTVIMLLAGTVPIMTFIVERWVTRRFIDPALGEGSGQGQPAAPPVRSAGG